MATAAVAAFQSASLKARLAPLYFVAGQHLELGLVHAGERPDVVVARQVTRGQEVAHGRRGLPSDPVRQVAAGGVGVDSEDPVAAHRGQHGSERDGDGGFAHAALETEDADLVGLTAVRRTPADRSSS